MFFLTFPFTVGMAEITSVMEEFCNQLQQSIQTVRITPHLNTTSATVGVEYVAGNIRTGKRGRPKKDVTANQIIHLKNVGFDWMRICEMLHISRSTLYRYKHLFNIDIPQINDEELNSNIRDILSQTPGAGETYVIGGLRGRNISVSRRRVREQINNIDPVGRALRKTRALHRRIYNVKGPNYLW